MNEFLDGADIDQNSVSSQCACGNSSNARKPEDNPNFLCGKTLFKKRNPPDFKFYHSNKLANNVPYMVHC